MLRPGQTIEMEMHAAKGLGKDHAKFGPVGAHPSMLSSRPSSNPNFWWCSNGELSVFILDEPNPVSPHLATRFKDCFPPEVINIAPQIKSLCRQDNGSQGAAPS